MKITHFLKITIPIIILVTFGLLQLDKNKPTRQPSNELASGGPDFNPDNLSERIFGNTIQQRGFTTEVVVPEGSFFSQENTNTDSSCHSRTSENGAHLLTLQLIYNMGIEGFQNDQRFGLTLESYKSTLTLFKEQTEELEELAYKDGVLSELSIKEINGEKFIVKVSIETDENMTNVYSVVIEVKKAFPENKRFDDRALQAKLTCTLAWS